MRNRARPLLLWLLLMIAGACGCSANPAKLARRIAGADQIVATNSGTGAVLSIRGDAVRPIIRAVSCAKRDRNNYAAVFDWQIRFYSGTNLLDIIRLQD